MKLILAPMQGVVDFQMRRLLTDIGGYDRCVTEFVRVTDQRVPAKVFLRLCPELLEDGCTRSGTPVYVQLLGGNPLRMSESATTAVKLGAKGIDINFGCPAKIVNRHDGGSVLLKEPRRIGEIVREIRNQIPSSIPVTAKIRLGFEDDSVLADIVGQIHEAGATELCIHARTRQQGYKPPAHWKKIGKLAQPYDMPIFINGEIWSTEDAITALQQSRCQNIMIGRGGLACPDLALRIRATISGYRYHPMEWLEVIDRVQKLFEEGDSHTPRYTGNRTKQWLGYLIRQYPEAITLFQQIKRLREPTEIIRQFETHRAENRHFKIAS